MKALTVRHPWAWAIIEGGKDVENRTRKTNYRGPLYIHAAKAMDFDAFTFPALEDAENAYIARNCDGPFGDIKTIDLSTCGMVLGTVELVGCHHASECGPEKAIGGYAIRGDSVSPVMPEEMCSAWAMDDHYHWVLSNPLPLEIPFDATGKLGIWNLKDQP